MTFRTCARPPPSVLSRVVFSSSSSAATASDGFPISSTRQTSAATNHGSPAASVMVRTSEVPKLKTAGDWVSDLDIVRALLPLGGFGFLVLRLSLDVIEKALNADDANPAHIAGG